MIRRVGPFVVACAAGFALGVAWPVVAPDAPDAGATPWGGAAELPPCPAIAPLAREADAVSRELGRLEAEILKGRVLDAAHIGLPVEWPDDLPDRWREASIERALRDALGEDGEILTLDCSEYPCVAVVAPLARVASVEAGQSRAQALAAALEDAGLSPWSSQSAFGAVEGQLLLETLTFVAPGHDVPPERQRFRVDELFEAARPAASELLGASREEGP